MAINLGSITKLPPQKLAIIAAVGIGGGLLWRRHAANKAATVTPAAAGYDPNSAVSTTSAGNLAAAQTQQVPSTNDATRDVGQGTITLPVVRWTVMIGGHEFLTNGTTLWNMDGSPYSGPPPADNGRGDVLPAGRGSDATIPNFVYNPTGQAGETP